MRYILSEIRAMSEEEILIKIDEMKCKCVRYAGYSGALRAIGNLYKFEKVLKEKTK